MRYLKSIIIALVIATLAFYLSHLPKKSQDNQPLEIKKTAILLKTQKANPKIAVVLDDWGYNKTNLAVLLELKGAVTLAILPNLFYSNEIAEFARQHGYQAILHLPLESKSNKYYEKDTIYCSMDEKEAREKVRLLIKSIPNIKGANNHQGSKATEDSRLMRIVLSELKNSKMFFLDSFTTGQSVCQSVAKSVGIKFARRDVFIDLPPTELKEDQARLYIQKQLYKLMGVAERRGQAIGIGHDRKLTLSVLKEFIPQAQKRGIEFVFLSELEKLN